MTFRPDIPAMPPQVLAKLAPDGVLRAGINLSNFLLVTGQTPQGDPDGVSPDMARALADNLGVRLQLVPYKSPGLLADASVRDEWDIGLIGAEPQRAEVISFSPAYTEIEATYLVPARSTFKTAADVDSVGTRIAVTARTAYGLWLERNIQHAQIIGSDTFDATLKDFVDHGMEALAGLRSRLITDVNAVPGARILDGRFMAVQQAIGTPKAKAAALDYITRFIEASKSSGFVAHLIEKHGAEGLSVAALGDIVTE